ncbi:MAG TPA: nitrogenase component 1 [Halanaerobiales bacterium]|nr:nitrogenase component 1 [Halanaerobiales bacterium]
MYISSERERIEPLKGCAMVGIIEGIMGITDARPLVHGPMSCSSGHRMVFLFADKEPILPTTALTEEELVLGSQEKLKAALYKAYELYQPKYLVIIITCAISLSGEEYNSIIDKFESEHDCKVSVLDGSGLYGEEVDGFNQLYNDLWKRFEINNNINSNTLSLDGMALSDVNAEGNYNILYNLLTNYFNLKIGPSLFMNLNINNDLNGYKNSQKIKIGHLWNNYEIKDNKPAPYGIEGTYQWLQWFANQFSKKLKPELEKDYKQYKDKFKELTKGHKYNELKIVVEGDSWYSLGLANFLINELGSQVLLSTDNYGIKYNKKHGIIKEIYDDMGGYELFIKAKEFKPDIVFGSSYIRCKKKWEIVPYTQPIYHLYDNDIDLMGFTGTFNLLEILNDIK